MTVEPIAAERKAPSQKEPAPLDKWRLRFGILLLALLFLSPIVFLLAVKWGKADHCETYWTGERKVEQLWAAYLTQIEFEDEGARKGTGPLRARVPLSDINQMFFLMRACARESGLEACSGRLGTVDRAAPERKTSSGLTFAWTVDSRSSWAEHLAIDVSTATGVSETRKFYLPGCDFQNVPWRMPH